MLKRTIYILALVAVSLHLSAQAQKNLTQLYSLAKSAFAQKNYEQALGLFQQIETSKEDKKPQNWSAEYQKCQKDFLAYKDSILEVSEQKLRLESIQCQQFEAKSLALESIVTNQEIQKAQKALQAWEAAMELDSANYPSIIDKAIFQASLKDLGTKAASETIPTPIKTIQLSNDEKKLFVGLRDGRYNIIPIIGDEVLLSESSFSAPLTEEQILTLPIQQWLALDDLQIISFSSGGKLYIKKPNETQFSSIQLHEESQILRLYPSGDKDIISLGSENIIRKFKSTSSSISNIMGHTSKISDLSLVNYKSELLFHSLDGSLFVCSNEGDPMLNLVSDKQARQISRIHHMEDIPQKDKPDANLLLLLYKDGQVQVQNYRNGSIRRLYTQSIHGSKITEVLESKESLILYSLEGTLSLWDKSKMLTEENYTPLVLEIEPRIIDIAYAQKSKKLYYLSASNEIKQLSIDTQYHRENLCHKLSEKAQKAKVKEENLPSYLIHCK